MMGPASRRLAPVGCLAFFALACTTTPYPAPKAPGPPPPTIYADTTGRDNGDTGAIAALEERCRMRLRGDTADASLEALDRMRQLLGESCELRTVENDPLHFRLRCRSDALFASGSFELSRRRVRCKEAPSGQATTWDCLGAIARKLLADEAIERLAVAVVGHVDLQPLNVTSEAHLCKSVQTSLDYKPPHPWRPVPAGAAEEARLYANDQLAFCRAGAVALEIVRGLGQRGAKQATDLAVLGAGATWLRSQPKGCPTRSPERQEGVCAAARRGDVLLGFSPKLHSEVSRCQADAAHNALTCLQDCREQAAVGFHTGAGLDKADAPLFSNRAAPGRRPPPGFYLKQKAAGGKRRLQLPRVCKAVGIAAHLCK